jgi:RNA polymerase sigma factor (sigma-70 family)
MAVLDHDTGSLIQAAQTGNKTAVNDLYQRYVNRVRAVVRARIGPALRAKEQSDDIVQEALLKSLAGLGEFEYRTDGAFIAYLAKKVREVIGDRADHWATERRRANGEIPLDALRPTGSAIALSMLEMRSDASPERIAMLREDIDRLACALDLLKDQSPEYWDLIVAVKVEGRSYAELADEFALPVPAGRATDDQQRQIDSLKQKTCRAMAKLVKIFKSLGSASISTT